EVDARDVTITRSVVTVPFNRNASSFSSSNETLNRVWQLCKDTMEATSFCGVYVDGDRERLPYEADAYINMLGHYCVDRSYATARHTHELLMLEPTWPTEWILFSVLMAWQDYLHTGDDTSIRQHIKTIDAKSLQALAGPDGLISTTNKPQTKEILKTIYRKEAIRDIVDWPQGERDNVELMSVSTIINAFYLAALRDLGNMYRAIGFDVKSDEVLQIFKRTYQTFQEKCFDPVLERYTDGVGSKHAGLHANMFPLAFGLVPDQWMGKVADYVVGRGMACSVYGAQFLIDGLYQAGRASDALALLTSRADRSWGHMVYDVGTTIALEAWDTRYKPNQDWNHAWGAAPANLIPRWIVGVWPTSPGAETIRVAPQPGDLESFTASVPTVRGTVTVAFKQSGAGAKLTVGLPGSMSADVTLPRPPGKEARRVKIGNRRVGAEHSYRLEGGAETRFEWSW
ncbi:MAG: alpha-L-rhamnosidase C-terminal domain-containing protein, partial [Armatimonadota bacterium]